MEQIPGQLFSPCFLTEAEYENAYKQSDFYVEKDYMEEYRKHMVAMQHIASMAKSYILNNWSKVNDWTELNVIVTHGPTGEKTEYFNYVPSVFDNKKSSETWNTMMQSLEDCHRQKHNPIRVIDTVVLDPTDGDFSLTINGKEHWWIGDEEIIVIADYIESYLKNN
jgi:hypothetical protein